MAETLLEKSIRHIKDGSFDKDSLVSGGKQLMGLLRSYREAEGRLIGPAIFTDYAGIEDFKVSEYKLVVPSLIHTMDTMDVLFRVYDYPIRSRLSVAVTPTDSRYIHTHHFLSLKSHAFSSFTGPTFDEPGFTPRDLPNNGFYSKFSEAYVPFRPVYEGQRKGALAVTEMGEVQILSDSHKDLIVSVGFKGYEAVVGCSDFITDKDDWSLPAFVGTKVKNQYSYLIKYELPNGDTRTAFIMTPGIISLVSFRRVFEDYVDRMGGLSYKAVGLEHTGASAVVRPPFGRLEYYGGKGFDRRRDHYLVSV